VLVVASYVSLMQVLKRKQLDSSDVQQVSVRRFSSFNLFSRSRVTPTETDDPSDGQWVDYRSAIFPQYSALLRYAREIVECTVCWCFLFPLILFQVYKNIVLLLFSMKFHRSHKKVTSPFKG